MTLTKRWSVLVTEEPLSGRLVPMPKFPDSSDFTPAGCITPVACMLAIVACPTSARPGETGRFLRMCVPGQPPRRVPADSGAFLFRLCPVERVHARSVARRTIPVPHVFCPVRPFRRSGSCPELTFLSSREEVRTRRA